MELRQLRHFLAVIEHGSMANAAKALGLSPQAVGQSINRLEKDAGVPLFDRSQKTAVPTDYARVLVAHSHRLLNQHRIATDELSSMKIGIAGRIRVGFSAPVSGEVGAEALSLFQSRYPAVQVSLNGGHIDPLIATLRRGDLDVVAGIAKPALYSDPEIELEELFEAPTLLIARRGHPLASRSKISLENIAQYPWIVFGRDGETHGPVPMLDQFQRAGVSPPSQLVHNSSTSAALGLLDKGDYIVMTVAHAVPLSVAGPYYSRSPFVWLNVDSGMPQRKACIIRNSGVTLSQPSELFCEALRQSVRDSELNFATAN